MLHLTSRDFSVCLLLFFALFLALAEPVAAESVIPAPENRIPGPMVLPQGWPGGEVMPARIAAMMNHFSWSESKLYKGSSRYDYKTPMGTKVGPRRLEQFVDVFKIRYSFTDRFEIRTATPYINAEVKNYGGGAWKGGLGDTTMMLRYGLKKRSEDSPFSLAVDLGVPYQE